MSKTMMKRIISLVLTALLVFALAGCKVTSSSSSTVTTSTTDADGTTTTQTTTTEVGSDGVHTEPTTETTNADGTVTKAP